MGKKQNSKCSQRRKNKKIELENKNFENYLSFINSIDPQTVQGQCLTVFSEEKITKLDNYDKKELKKELDEELDCIFSLETTFDIIEQELDLNELDSKELKNQEKSFLSTFYGWFIRS